MTVKGWFDEFGQKLRQENVAISLRLGVYGLAHGILNAGGD
jgi:hypothetical protein